MGKMIFRYSLIFVLLSFHVNIHPVFAGDDRWWGKHNEGWFFYKDPAVSKENTLERKKDQPVPASVHNVPSKPEEQKLFTEGLREKGSELLSTAMQFPTSENLQNYIRWNKMMLDLSNNFALLWQKELMADPALQYDIPMVDAVKDVYFAEKSKNEEDIIKDTAERAGLFFFYSSTCPYCEKQVGYLKEFSDYYGFRIKAVSINGGTLPDFPDTLMDNGISVRLGVEKVPAIFLAFPDEKRFERLSAGLITFAELKQRVLSYAAETNSNINYSSLIN
jgi:conjugal transfer pilus assembly protein TraF